ncbi:MAG: zinc ribbon domain-containing protein [Ornithinibacter sp.]
MAADVDVPRTWSLALQGAFWSSTGPAAALKGRWRMPIFGNSIEWLDPQARDYWGRIVGDPEVYPSVPEYPPGGPADGDERHCGRCGAQATSDDVFCRACGSRLH